MSGRGQGLGERVAKEVATYEPVQRLNQATLSLSQDTGVNGCVVRVTVRYEGDRTLPKRRNSIL